MGCALPKPQKAYLPQKGKVVSPVKRPPSPQQKKNKQQNSGQKLPHFPRKSQDVIKPEEIKIEENKVKDVKDTKEPNQQVKTPEKKVIIKKNPKQNQASAPPTFLKDEPVDFEVEEKKKEEIPHVDFQYSQIIRSPKNSKSDKDPIKSEKSLKDQVDRLLQQIEQCNKEIEAHKSQAELLPERDKVIQEQDAQIGQLRSLLQQQEEESAELKIQLDELREQIDNLLEEHERQEQDNLRQIQDLQDQVDKYQDDYSKLQSQQQQFPDTVSKELNDLRKRIEVKEARIIELNRAVKDSEAKCSKIKMEQVQTNAIIDGQVTQIVELKQTIQYYQTQMTILENMNKEFSNAALIKLNDNQEFEQQSNQVYQHDIGDHTDEEMDMSHHTLQDLE